MKNGKTRLIITSVLMLVLVLPTLFLEFAANQLIELSEGFAGGLVSAGIAVSSLLQIVVTTAAVFGIVLANKPQYAKVNVILAVVLLAAEAAAAILMNVFAVIILPLIILTAIYMSGALCSRKMSADKKETEQP